MMFITIRCFIQVCYFYPLVAARTIYDAHAYCFFMRCAGTFPPWLWMTYATLFPPPPQLGLLRPFGGDIPSIGPVLFSARF